MKIIAESTDNNFKLKTTYSTLINCYSVPLCNSKIMSQANALVEIPWKSRGSHSTSVQRHRVSSPSMSASHFVHSMVDAADLKAFEEHLQGAQHIAITSHRSPDADAVGTSLALARYLSRQGKSVQCILPDAPDEALDWMPGVSDILLFERDPGLAQEALHRADVLFALDYNGLNRLGPMEDAARSATGQWLMVDHHIGPEDFTAAKVHDARCSSTAELLYGVLSGLGGVDAVDGTTAALLYAGMMTDTGSFRFRSVSSETHRVVAAMMNRGWTTPLFTKPSLESSPWTACGCTLLRWWSGWRSTLNFRWPSFT